jgi:hypothetical protein
VLSAKRFCRTADDAQNELWLLLDSFDFEAFEQLCRKAGSELRSHDGKNNCRTLRIYGLPCLLRRFAEKVCHTQMVADAALVEGL